MSAPPVDLPPPGLASVSVGLPPSPAASSLCGFKFPPTAFFKFKFNLPGIPFPLLPPIPHIGLVINCNLSNPLGVTSGLPWGAGRVPNADPDPDLLENADS